MMRTRKHHVSIWLNDAELAYLKKQADIAGLKVDPFVRKLIMGSRLAPRPPDEWAELLRQVSAVGNNVNQLAHHANANKAVSPEMIQEVLRLQKEIWKKVKMI